MAAGLAASSSLHIALAPLRKQLRTSWTTFGAPAAQELRDQGHNDIAVAITTAVTSGSASQWARSEVAAAAVVDAAWQHARAHGWSTSWREVYVLGQLCLAAARAASALNDACSASGVQGSGGQCNAEQPGRQHRHQAVEGNEPCNTAAAAVAAMKAVDEALILGLPLETAQPFVSLIDPLARQHIPAFPHASPDSCVLPTTAATFRPIPEANSIVRCSAKDLSEDAFSEKYLSPGKPVIITGAMGQWPACTTWPQLAWWSRNYGHRSVPVELGSAGQPGWREEVLLLGRFVSEHLAPLVQRENLPAADSAAANQEPHSMKGDSMKGQDAKVHTGDHGGGADGDVGQMDDTGCHPADVAYLAQHPLLDQLSALARDIAVPPYCGDTGARITNVWIGSGSAKTPLHFDSYDNFLCQVAGSKYVRLFAPDQAHLLYVDNSDSLTKGRASRSSPPTAAAAANPADRTRQQKNVSVVDVEQPDLERFPLFSQAKFQEAVLQPGEMLFIPYKWFHFVRTLPPMGAISVNFWF